MRTKILTVILLASVVCFGKNEKVTRANTQINLDSLIAVRLTSTVIFNDSVSSPQDILYTEASSVADSIDIRKIVNDQIEQARKKEETAKTIPATVSATVVTAGLSGNEVPSFSAWYKNELIWKGGLLAVVSVAALTFVLIRRRKVNSPKKLQKALKKNIKNLREEKLIETGDSKLSAIRNRLRKNIKTYSENGGRFAQKARELNIAEGELLLAARIRSHEMIKVRR